MPDDSELLPGRTLSTVETRPDEQQVEEWLDVDVLTGALSGMGVIDNGTWVSFNRADAERIAELYALHARLAATPSAQDEETP